jgi:hypothetical protein
VWLNSRGDIGDESRWYFCFLAEAMFLVFSTVGPLRFFFGNNYLWFVKHFLQDMDTINRIYHVIYIFLYPFAGFGGVWIKINSWFLVVKSGRGKHNNLALVVSDRILLIGSQGSWHNKWSAQDNPNFITSYRKGFADMLFTLSP